MTAGIPFQLGIRWNPFPRIHLPFSLLRLIMERDAGDRHGFPGKFMG